MRRRRVRPGGSESKGPKRKYPTCAVQENGDECGYQIYSSPSGTFCQRHGGGVPVDGDESLALKIDEESDSEQTPGKKGPLIDLDLVDQFPTITVTAGQEVYKPIDYHSMVVGPLSITMPIDPNVDPKKAAALLGTMLEEMFEVEFQRKKAGMLRRMRELADEVRAQAGKGKRR